MGEERMITVPYGDFVDGVIAKADLDSIRAIVYANKYDSDSISAIKAMLGIEENKTTEAE